MPRTPRKDIDAGLPEQSTVSGYMTKYDPALAMRMLEGIAAGKTRNELDKDPALPAFVTFIKWTLLDPKLREAWEEARRISALLLEDRALEEAQTLVGPAAEDYTGTRVRAAEVAMNQWRWSAARRDRQTFGDRADGSLVVPIQINTTLDLGNGITQHMPATEQTVDPFRVSFTPDEPVLEQAPMDDDEADEALTQAKPPIPTPPDELSSPLAQPKRRGRPPNATKRPAQSLNTRKRPAKGRPRKTQIKEKLG